MNASLLHPRFNTVLALCCCALASGVAAASESSGSVRQLTVSYADLDLSREEGAQTLYRRLRAAAHEVCDSGADVRQLAARAAYRKCVEQAIAGAVRSIDREALTALHRRKAMKLAAG